MANLGTLGSLFIDVAANTATFETDIGRAAKLAEQRSREIQKGFQDAAKNIAAAFLSVQAATAVFKAFTRDIPDAIASYKDLSEKIGDTAQAIAALKPVSTSSGVAFETIAGSSIKLTASLSKQTEESAGAAAAIKSLGLDFNTFKRLSPVAELQAVAKGLAKFEDGAGKTAVAVALFGKSGAELLPFLNELANRGVLQAKLTDEQIKQADDYGDRLNELKGDISTLAQQYGASLIPTLDIVVQTVADLIHEFDNAAGQKDAIQDFARTTALVFATVAEAIAGAARAAITLGSSFRVVFNDIKAIATFPGLLASKEDKADYADFLKERAATLKSAGQQYVDLIEYNGTAISDALKKAFLKADVERYGIPAFDPVGDALGTKKPAGPLIFDPNPKPAKKPELVFTPPDPAAQAAAAKAAKDAQTERENQAKRGIAAEEASRAAVASAQRQLSLLQEQADGQGKVGEAAKLRYEIERGSYAQLDEFTKARLTGLAKEIEAAEKVADANEKRVRTAGKLINQFSPRKSGGDFSTQLGAAQSLGQVNGIVSNAVDDEDSRYATEIAAFEDSQAQITALGGDYYALRAAAAQAHQDELTRIEQDGAAARLNITQSYLSAGSQIVGNLSAAAEAAGLARTKRGFEVARLLNITQATISTAAAVTNALAVPPYPLGLALAGSAGLAGAAQIAVIKNAKFGGGRRYGGGVSAGGLYEVAEPGNPELIKYGNKTMLAMGDQSGTVTPARVVSAQAGMAAANAARYDLKFEFQNTVSDLVGTRIERLRGLNGEQVVRVMTEAVSDNANEFSRANSRKNNVRQAGRIG